MSVPVYRVTAVFLDGTVPTDGTQPLLPIPQDLSWPKWSDGRVLITAIGQNGAAFSLSGGAFIFTVKARPTDTDPIISREATITVSAGGVDAAYVPIGSNDVGISTKSYGYTLEFIDVNGKIWEPIPLGTFAVEPSDYTPGQNVTVPSSQQPLAQGIQGSPGGVLWSLTKTWATVYAEFVAQGAFGDIWVESDPTFAPRQIPAGNYNLVKANFNGLANGLDEGPIIEFLSGATIDTGGSAALRGYYVSFRFHGKLSTDGVDLYLQLRYALLERATGYAGAAFAAIPSANANLFEGSAFINNDSGIVPIKGHIDFANNATALIGLSDSSLCKGVFSGTATNLVFIGARGQDAIQSLRLSGVYVSPFLPFLAGAPPYVLPPFATVDLPTMPDPVLVGSVAWDLTTGQPKISDGINWNQITTETAIGSEPIAAMEAIKKSATASRYARWLKTDNPNLFIGVAVTICGGAGQLFAAQFLNGALAVMLSDGTGTIAAWAACVLSDTVNAHIKQGLVTDAGFIGFNAGPLVAATLDAQVIVR